MDGGATTAELHQALSVALEMADHLGLTMVAIHIDEAQNRLMASDTATAH